MVSFAHGSVGLGFGQRSLHGIVWLSRVAGKGHLLQEDLSARLAGLPHFMVVGLQEGAFQVAKVEAANLLGPSLRVAHVTIGTFYWPNRPQSQP